MTDRRLLLAVDAPSLLHRNHHARVESQLHDRGGRPAWALHGMLRQILEAIDQFAPDAVLFGLDDRTSSVREQAYPAYKAGRAEKDPLLVDQLDRAGALLDALGMLHLHAARPRGRRRQRLGGDLGRARRVELRPDHLRPRRLRAHQRPHPGAAADHRRDHRLAAAQPRPLHAMYGVAAEHYLEYAALRGDASDNLPGVPGIGEKSASVLLSQMGSMQAVWADIEHSDGAMLVATLDSYCEEQGTRRIGASVLKRLATAEARERFEFNLAMMSGRTDLDLGLTPDVPGSPGLLPLEPDRVARVVGHLGVPSTTDLALRVLTEPPASYG